MGETDKRKEELKEKCPECKGSSATCGVCGGTGYIIWKEVGRLADAKLPTANCPHSSIESNMCPTHCKDCGKVLDTTQTSDLEETVRKYVYIRPQSLDDAQKMSEELIEILKRHHADLARTIRDDLMGNKEASEVQEWDGMKYQIVSRDFISVEDLLEYFKDRFNV